MNYEDPLHMLPVLAWKQILDNLKEPRDLLNCQIACTLFRDILRPSQCAWLFGKVFSHVVPYLPQREILACRYTGRNWKKVVDNFLEYRTEFFAFDETDYDFEYNYLQYPSHLWDTKCGITQFFNLREMEWFIRNMRRPVRNSAVGRYVELNLRSFGWENRQEVIAQKSCSYICNFLTVLGYGQHVHHFQLMKPQETERAVGTLVHLLRMFLAALPNLRTLEIAVLEQVNRPELGTFSI